MSGYNTVLSLRKLEERIDSLGFHMGHPKYGYYAKEFGDLVALFAKEDSLPIFSRDAEIFIGTLEQLEHWLNGWEKLASYHRMLFGKTFEEKVLRKEQDYRNQNLLNEIKKAGKEEVKEN